MGAQLVRLAYARWNHLPDRAFRLLVFMALTAMDDAEVPVYYGGRESLARLGLGRITPDEPFPGDNSARANEFRKARTNDFQAVRAALRELNKAGAVAVDKAAGPGRNTVYSLHLDRGMAKGEPTEQGRLTQRTGKADSTERGRLTLPLTTKEEPTTTSEGTTSAQVTTSLAALPDYNDAAKYLSQLPDLGMRYLDEITGEYTLPERVILAAAAARKDREAS